MRPYVYQAECLDAILAARMRGHAKNLVVMAPGLGKTATSAFEIRRLLKEDPGPVLYLCNQRHVLRQARKTYREVLGSERSAGYLFGGSKTATVKTRIVFATFQIMVNQRFDFDPRHFRYIVVDEVHHSQAETFRPTLEYFSPEYMIGLTATLERSDGLDVRDLFDGREPIFDLGLPIALARGLSCRIHYRVMDDEIDYGSLQKAKPGSIGLPGLNKKIFVPKRDHEIARLIAEKTSHIPNPRILVFCASRRHANAMAKLLPNSTCVHSGFSATVNDWRFVDFKKGAYSTLVTVDMCNEGVDIPDVNVIVFLRSIQWIGLFLQQIGRGTRLAKGKDKLLVLDFVANCERIEMIAALRDQVEKALAEIPARDNAKTISMPFILNIGDARFSEREVDILSAIRRIREGNTVESLTKLLLDKASKLKRSPHANEVDEDPNMPNAKVFNVVFGVRTWDSILVEVGLEPCRLDGLNEAELISRIRDLRASLGHTPTSSEASRCPSLPCVKTILKTFRAGTWNEVVVRCGSHVGSVAKDDARKAQLSRELAAKAAVLGRAPKARELDDDPNMENSIVYMSVFSKPYRGILEELGLLKNAPANLAAILLKMQEETGEFPSSRDVNDSPDLPSSNTIVHAFNVRYWSEVRAAVEKYKN